MIGINMSHVVSRPSFLAARKGWTMAVVVAMMGLSWAASPVTAQTVASGTDATTAAPAELRGAPLDQECV